MDKCIEIFVPGRLCLFGEHSDWASTYQNVNSEIEGGAAIVNAISEGIFAEASINKKIILKEKKYKSINCNYEDIDFIIKQYPFWKYVLCTISYIKDKYKKVEGIYLNIKKVTLPMKKGLGSSAAICLLVVKAYNILYNLNLTEEEEANVAYYSELLSGSKCGKLDQINNFLPGAKLVTFDSDNVVTKSLIVAKDIYMVYADLNGSKDTIKILSDLNSCYPYPKNNVEKRVHNFLGKTNKKFVFDACKALEQGEIEKLGLLMTKYQKEFDSCLINMCSELQAPLLHNLLNDVNITELTYGAKGCGSGGDGSIQFVAKDKKCQQQLMTYLKDLKLNSWAITINGNKIKKAIIPVGGFGSRMYPMTKIIGKEFLPIKDVNGIIKPAILILLEELIDSGIEQIGLILPSKYKKRYVDFFLKNYDLEGFEKDSEKLKQIFNRLKFINDKSQSGLGNSINLCKRFIGKEKFMLLLGDQIYKSYDNSSCVKQILDFYYTKFLSVISAGETKLDKVSNYGILYGDNLLNDKYFYIKNIVEKPSAEFAKKNLKMVSGGKEKFYSVFGCYILEPSILNGDNNFSNNLSNYVNEKKCIAFIPNGKYYDIGNRDSYYDTFVNFGRIDLDEKNN